MELTITLKNSILKRINKRKKELNLDTDALINKALEDYFYFERLNELRQKYKSKANKQGYLAEEDILKDIS